MSPLLRLLVNISVPLLRKRDSIEKIRAAGEIIVFAASYGAIEGRDDEPKRLAAATTENFDRAIWIARQPGVTARVAFGGCQHSLTKPFVGAGEFERKTKASRLYEATFESDQFLDIGPIASSFTEMEALRERLLIRHIKHDTIVIVTCELHSKAEYVLAKMMFPDSEILVWCNSHELEVEPDHSTADQRTWGRWLWCSWLRYVAFKVASLSPGPLRARIFEKLRKAQHDPA